MREISRAVDKELQVNNYCAGLSPQKERDGNMEDVGMALQARMMSKLFRVVTGAASKNKCTLVFINQIRSSMDMYKPEATSGGAALRFYASQRVSMRKVKVMAGDPIKDDEGVKINCSTVKNRASGQSNPYKRCTYYALFGKGIDRIIAIPDIMEREGIVRKAGAWYYWEDENGKPLTVAGVECRFQGRNALIDTLRNNEAFYEEVVRVIEEKISLGATKGESLSAEEIAEAKRLEAEEDLETSEDSMS